MTRPLALALSPHLDDAAFSCGGTLAGLVRAGWRVVIATLFTRSVPDPTGFALACQLDKGLGPEIDYMALRRDEDAAASLILGAEAEWLPFPEAPHRGYESAVALFAAPRNDDTIIPTLADAIIGLARRHAPALILAPQAIGGHVDHVQIVRALDEARPTAPVAWWRDHPYVTRTRRPTEPFGTRFSTVPEHCVVLAPEDVEAKRRACHAYASQIGFQFGGPVALDAMLAAAAGIERWRGAVPS